MHRRSSIVPLFSISYCGRLFCMVLLNVVGDAFCAEPNVPLRWKHVGNTVEVHVHHYVSPNKTKRVIRIVHERVSINRELTRDEIIAVSDYLSTKDEQGLWHMRPQDTFQWRSSRAICWVLDGEVDAKLDEMTPLGVVYFSGAETCGYIFMNYSADILWHPAREQHLLLLAMSCTNNLTVAVFPLDLDHKLDVKPFAFADKHPAESPRPETKWPKPLAPIAEMRTDLPDGICDIMAIRAVPEWRVFRGQDPETNVLISAWNTRSSGATCNSVTYRYQLRARKWTQVTFDERGEVPVKLKSRGDEKLDKELEIPPEEGDPGEPRRPKPLEPMSDQAASEKPTPTPIKKYSQFVANIKWCVSKTRRPLPDYRTTGLLFGGFCP